ncbi:MAG TPA: hypothetical protein VGP24_00780 [Glaciihabitans sp.]|nr:hypothetical protein [Glaciihabitans sp.]
MATTRTAQGQGAGTHSAGSVSSDTWENTEQTGWTGWVVFAAVIMLMMGTFHVIQGFVALFQDTYYLVAETGLVVQVDYTTWGWVHVLLGVLVGLAGLGLLSGQMWARIIAIILAFGSAIVNISFMAAYPFWSLALLALDVLVIWAVAVHGKEMKSIFTA